MATNKNFDIDDQLAFDDLDLDAMGMDADTPKGKTSKSKKIVATLFKDTSIGASKGIRRALKSEFTETSDQFDDISKAYEDAQRAADEIGDTFKPVWSSMKKITLGFMPLVKNLMPKSWYEKTHGWLSAHVDEEEETPEQREARQRQEQIASSLNDIFKGQKTATETDMAYKAAETMTNNIKFKHQQLADRAIVTSLKQVVTYLHGPTTGYMKKSLELQYQHLFVAKDLYKATATIGSILNSKLEEIKHNTSLPESVKINSMKRGGVSGFIGNLATKSLGGLFSAMINTGKSKIISSLKDMGSTLGMMEGAADSAGMMSPFSWLTATSSLLGLGANWFAGKAFGDKLRSASNTVKDLDQGATGWLGSLKRLILHKAKQGRNSEGGLLGSLFSFLMPEETKQSSITNEDVTDPTKAIAYDVSSKMALTKVIPRHLERIGDFVEAAFGTQQKFVDAWGYKNSINGSELKTAIIHKEFNAFKQTLTSHEDVLKSVRAKAYKSDQEIGKQLSGIMATSRTLAYNGAGRRFKLDDSYKGEDFEKQYAKFISNLAAARSYLDIYEVEDLYNKFLTDAEAKWNKTPWEREAFEDISTINEKRIVNYLYSQTHYSNHKQDSYSIEMLVQQIQRFIDELNPINAANIANELGIDVTGLSEVSRQEDGSLKINNKIGANITYFKEDARKEVQSIIDRKKSFDARREEYEKWVNEQALPDQEKVRLLEAGYNSTGQIISRAIGPMGVDALHKVQELGGKAVEQVQKAHDKVDEGINKLKGGKTNFIRLIRVEREIVPESGKTFAILHVGLFTETLKSVLEGKDSKNGISGNRTKFVNNGYKPIAENGKSEQDFPLQIVDPDLRITVYDSQRVEDIKALPTWQDASKAYDAAVPTNFRKLLTKELWDELCKRQNNYCEISKNIAISVTTSSSDKYSGLVEMVRTGKPDYTINRATRETRADSSTQGPVVDMRKKAEYIRNYIAANAKYTDHDEIEQNLPEYIKPDDKKAIEEHLERLKKENKDENVTFSFDEKKGKIIKSIKAEEGTRFVEEKVLKGEERDRVLKEAERYATITDAYEIEKYLHERQEAKKKFHGLTEKSYNFIKSILINSGEKEENVDEKIAYLVSKPSGIERNLKFLVAKFLQKQHQGIEKADATIQELVSAYGDDVFKSFDMRKKDIKDTIVANRESESKKRMDSRIERWKQENQNEDISNHQDVLTKIREAVKQELDELESDEHITELAQAEAGKAWSKISSKDRDRYITARREQSYGQSDYDRSTDKAGLLLREILGRRNGNELLDTITPLAERSGGDIAASIFAREEKRPELNGNNYGDDIENRDMPEWLRDSLVRSRAAKEYGNTGIGKFYASLDKRVQKRLRQKNLDPDLFAKLYDEYKEKGMSDSKAIEKAFQVTLSRMSDPNYKGSDRPMHSRFGELMTQFNSKRAEGESSSDSFKSRTGEVLTLFRDAKSSARSKNSKQDTIENKIDILTNRIGWNSKNETIAKLIKDVISAIDKISIKGVNISFDKPKEIWKKITDSGKSAFDFLKKKFSDIASDTKKVANSAMTSISSFAKSVGGKISKGASTTMKKAKEMWKKGKVWIEGKWEDAKKYGVTKWNQAEKCAKGYWEEFTNKLHEGKEYVKEKASSAKDKVTEIYHDVRDRVSKGYHDAKDWADKKIEAGKAYIFGTDKKKEFDFESAYKKYYDELVVQWQSKNKGDDIEKHPRVKKRLEKEARAKAEADKAKYDENPETEHVDGLIDRVKTRVTKFKDTIKENFTKTKIGSAINKVVKFFKVATYVDIYLKDKVEPGKPLLSKKKQEEGVFFEDGKKVEHSYDIDKPVFDSDKQTLITEEDLKTGLVDVDNKPIKAGVINAISDKIKEWSNGGIGSVLKSAWSGIKDAFGWLTGKAKTGADKTTSFFKRAFGIGGEDFTEYHNGVIARLDAILESLGHEPISKSAPTNNSEVAQPQKQEQPQPPPLPQQSPAPQPTPEEGGWNVDDALEDSEYGPMDADTYNSESGEKLSFGKILKGGARLLGKGIKGSLKLGWKGLTGLGRGYWNYLKFLGRGYKNLFKLGGRGLMFGLRHTPWVSKKLAKAGVNTVKDVAMDDTLYKGAKRSGRLWGGIGKGILRFIQNQADDDTMHSKSGELENLDIVSEDENGVKEAKTRTKRMKLTTHIYGTPSKYTPSEQAFWQYKMSPEDRKVVDNLRNQAFDLKSKYQRLGYSLSDAKMDAKGQAAAIRGGFDTKDRRKKLAISNERIDKYTKERKELFNEIVAIKNQIETMLDNVSNINKSTERTAEVQEQELKTSEDTKKLQEKELKTAEDTKKLQEEANKKITDADGDGLSDGSLADQKATKERQDKARKEKLEEQEKKRKEAEDKAKANSPNGAAGAAAAAGGGGLLSGITDKISEKVSGAFKGIKEKLVGKLEKKFPGIKDWTSMEGIKGKILGATGKEASKEAITAKFKALRAKGIPAAEAMKQAKEQATADANKGLVDKGFDKLKAKWNENSPELKKHLNKLKGKAKQAYYKNKGKLIKGVKSLAKNAHVKKALGSVTKMGNAAKTAFLKTGAGKSIMASLSKAGPGLLAKAGPLLMNPYVLAGAAGVAALGGGIYGGIKGWKNAGKNWDLKKGQKATATQKASSMVAGALTFGFGGKKATKAANAVMNFGGVNNLIKAFGGNKAVMDAKDIEKFQKKCAVHIQKGEKQYERMLARFNKAVSEEDWPMARAISNNEVSVAKELGKGLLKLASVTTGIGLIYRGYFEGAKWLLRDRNKDAMTQKEIDAFSKKMSARMKKGDRNAERVLNRFQKAVADENWVLARTLAGKKVDRMITQLAKKGIRNFSRSFLNPMGYITDMFIGTDRDKAPMKEKEIKAATERFAKLGAKSAKVRKLAARFQEAVENEDWKTARALSGNRLDATWKRDLKILKSISKWQMRIGTLGLSMLFEGESKNAPLDQKQIDSFTNRMEKKIKKGDKSAQRILDAFSEAVAQQQWARARKIAKIKTKDSVAVKAVKNYWGFWWGRQGTPLKQGEIDKFRDSMERKIKLGGGQAKRAETMLEKFNDYVEAEEWEKAREISKMKHEGIYEKMAKGAIKGINNLFFGSKDSTMPESEIKEARAKLQDDITQGKPNAQKKLDMFEDAIADENWRKARMIAQMKSTSAVRRGLNKISNFFTGADDEMSEMEINKFTSDMQKLIQKGGPEGDAAQKKLEMFERAVENRLWKKARALSNMKGQSFLESMGTKKRAFDRSISGKLLNATVRAMTFGLFGTKSSKKGEYTIHDCDSIRKELVDKVENDTDNSTIWNRILATFDAYVKDGNYTAAYNYADSSLKAGKKELKKLDRESRGLETVEEDMQLAARAKDIEANINKVKEKLKWYNIIDKTRCNSLLSRLEDTSKWSMDYFDEIELDLQNIDEEAGNTMDKDYSSGMDPNQKKLVEYARLIKINLTKFKNEVVDTHPNLAQQANQLLAKLDLNPLEYKEQPLNEIWDAFKELKKTKSAEEKVAVETKNSSMVSKAANGVMNFITRGLWNKRKVDKAKEEIDEHAKAKEEEKQRQKEAELKEKEKARIQAEQEALFSKSGENKFKRFRTTFFDSKYSDMSPRAMAERIKNDPIEKAVAYDRNGRIVAASTGDEGSVNIKGVPGGEIVHNHPDGSRITNSDKETAESQGLNKVTVASPNGIETTTFHSSSGQNLQWKKGAYGPLSEKMHLSFIDPNMGGDRTKFYIKHPEKYQEFRRAEDLFRGYTPQEYYVPFDDELREAFKNNKTESGSEEKTSSRFVRALKWLGNKELDGLKTGGKFLIGQTDWQKKLRSGVWNGTKSLGKFAIGQTDWQKKLRSKLWNGAKSLGKFAIGQTDWQKGIRSKLWNGLKKAGKLAWNNKGLIASGMLGGLGGIGLYGAAKGLSKLANKGMTYFRNRDTEIPSGLKYNSETTVSSSNQTAQPTDINIEEVVNKLNSIVGLLQCLISTTANAGNNIIQNVKDTSNKTLAESLSYSNTVMEKLKPKYKEPPLKPVEIDFSKYMAKEPVMFT